jgi:hypothetical protein
MKQLCKRIAHEDTCELFVSNILNMSKIHSKIKGANAPVSQNTIKL